MKTNISWLLQNSMKPKEFDKLTRRLHYMVNPRPTHKKVTRKIRKT